MGNTLTFADVVEAFEPDGSWRDLYAFETSEDHWRDFLGAVLRSKWPAKLVVNDRKSDQPDAAVGTLSDPDSTASLSIDVSGAILMCHFFTDIQIELDLVPAEFNKANFQSLVEFIALMANAITRNVYVTEENSPARAIFVHEFERSATTMISRPTEPTALSNGVGQLLHTFATRLHRRRLPVDRAEGVSEQDASTQRLFELSDAGDATTIDEWKSSLIYKPNRVEWHTQLTEKEFHALDELNTAILNLTPTLSLDAQSKIDGVEPTTSRIHFRSCLDLACRAFAAPIRDE